MEVQEKALRHVPEGKNGCLGVARVPLIARCAIWASCFTSLSLNVLSCKRKSKNNTNYFIDCWVD